jgi:hypothetical protein
MRFDVANESRTIHLHFYTITSTEITHPRLELKYQPPAIPLNTPRHDSSEIMPMFSFANHNLPWLYALSKS